MVSHDRYFLDQMATRIFEVEHHHLKAYEGNYSAYAEKKRALREAELRAYNKQQTEIRRQEDMIRRFKERGTEKLAKRAASQREAAVPSGAAGTAGGGAGEDEDPLPPGISKRP